MLLGGPGEPVLAAPAIAIDGLLARRRVPVRALPAHDLAEAGAARGEPVVQHALPHVARGRRLLEGPVHGVQPADHLHGARAQERGIGLKRRHAADVHVPEVHRRLAAHDPLRHRLAGARPRGDADRVEARGDEEVPALGRLAEVVAAVRREALRPVDVTAHRRRLDRGDADDRLLHQHLEVIPVLGQEREREVGRDALHAPGLGHRLEAAHQQAPDFLAHVDVAVGIAQHGQVGGDAVHRLGHDVEVLGGVQRHRHAGHGAEIARPHARAVDHDLAGDVAARGADARDGAAAGADRRHRGVLEDRDAALARALREGQRGVDGIRAPVARQPHRAGQVVGAQQRPAASRLGRRDHLGVDVEAARHRRQARQLVHALGVARQAEAARAAEARGLAGLRLEALVEVGAVLGEPGEVVGGAELADQPGGMPRGPARQLAALEQHDVAPAELGQVIRHAAAGDAAADHHHARLCGHRVTHPSLLHWVNLLRQIHSALASQLAR